MTDIDDTLDKAFEQADGLPMSLEDFVDVTGVPLSATREAAKALKLRRFGNAYALTRDDADALLEELESLGYSLDEDDEEDEDEDGES